MTVPFSERLSETWLLERTYHAQRRNGRELPVPDLTLAMKQLNDFDVSLALQSSKSKLAERLPLKKSTNFYVPLSTWREISQEEAYATYQQGIPVLLYGEHAWEHPKGASSTWSANKNMRVIISGNAGVQPEAVSGTNYAVCYLDQQQTSGKTVSDMFEPIKTWDDKETKRVGRSLRRHIERVIRFAKDTPFEQELKKRVGKILASEGEFHEDRKSYRS